MKRLAERVSEEMGLGGELTETVLAETQRRLETAAAWAARNAPANRVFRIKNLYPGDGNGCGYWLFPVDLEGKLFTILHPEISAFQQESFDACLAGKWQGYDVTEIL